MLRASHTLPVRRGHILPLTALVMVSLCGFVAMALDLGVIIVARTQCQNAADAGSLASTRNLDNKPTSTNSNQPTALIAANASVQQNQLLAGKFTSANITSVRYGVYDYNTAATPPQFQVSYPSAPPAGRSWTATEVTVNASTNRFFGQLIGSAALTTNARAVSVYRPRDIAMTLDMTGSMKNASLTSHNDNYASCDPVYPQMGHYQRYTEYLANSSGISTNNGSGPSGRTNPFFITTLYDAGGQYFAPNNFTAINAGGPEIVKDFFYDNSNLSNPSSTVITPSPNTGAVAPATPLPRAFHHWDPSVATAGNQATYTAPTYNYSSWNGVKDVNNFVLYPTPESFEDQSDANYIGDKWPRKYGKEWSTTGVVSWKPDLATGAAFNLIEYLGWRPRYSGGAINNPAPPARPILQTAYAADWSNFRDATWETYGYDLNVEDYINNRGASHDPRTVYASASVTAGRFKGYSMGPGYWGKTFFVWPPDPRTPVGDPGATGYVPGDWRQRFFLKTDGTALGVNVDNVPGSGTNLDNISRAILTNGPGSPLAITNAQVNYSAILKWLKQPPMALPPNLRAGRIVYYTSIPDDVNTAVGSAEVKLDKAFWKMYIDYVLYYDWMMASEARQWPDDTGDTGNQIFQNSLTQYDIDGIGPIAPDPQRPYMNYTDNPSRPRYHMWFGPVSMLAFIDDRNAMPGTAHQSQCWQLKAGVNSALDDIRNNHPNDSVGLCYFSDGDYGFISVGLGQEFEWMKASLFYPKDLVENGKVWSQPAAEMRAFNSGVNWQGDSKVQTAQSGTDPNTGLALCFNILAPSTTANPALPTRPPAPYANQTAARRGRIGASKIVIFETDGVPNNTGQVTYQAAGTNSYFTINVGANSSLGTNAAAYDVVDKIVAPMATGTTGNSGMSSPSSPAKVYSIGFGDLFSTTGSTNTNARNFLLEIQKRGGTSGSSDTAIPSYQIITGTYTARINSLRTAFERVLQSGVQVTLIE
jgi:Flp pilus assembly protein TadG